MRFLMIAVTAALAVAGGVRAQVVLPAAAPQPAVLAPAAPDPVRLDLAHKLVAASGGEEKVGAQMKAMMASVQKAVTAQMPPEGAKLMGPIYDAMIEDIVKLAPQILETTERAYADTFSESELRDLLAFQTSASGQAMIRKMPQVQAQIMNETMPLMMRNMPSVMRRAMDRICQQRHCTTGQREEMAKAMDRAFGRPAS